MLGSSTVLIYSISNFSMKWKQRFYFSYKNNSWKKFSFFFKVPILFVAIMFYVNFLLYNRKIVSGNISAICLKWKRFMRSSFNRWKHFNIKLIADSQNSSHFQFAVVLLWSLRISAYWTSYSQSVTVPDQTMR